MFYCLTGKILNDSNPLVEYNIQESNFVVVMVSKPKPAKSTSSTAEVYNLYVILISLFVNYSAKLVWEIEPETDLKPYLVLPTTCA